MLSKSLLFSIKHLSQIMLVYSKSDLIYVLSSFNNDRISNMIFFLIDPILFQSKKVFSTIHAMCSVHVTSLQNVSP